MSKTTTITGNLNQSHTFEDIRFEFTEVVEDSRCPEDVQCVHIGKIVARLKLTQGEKSGSFLIMPMMGRDLVAAKKANIIWRERKEILHQVVEFGGYNVTLLRVVPNRKSKQKINPEDYLFYLQFRPLSEEGKVNPHGPRKVEGNIDVRALEAFKQQMAMRKAAIW